MARRIPGTPPPSARIAVIMVSAGQGGAESAGDRELTRPEKLAEVAAIAELAAPPEDARARLLELLSDGDVEVRAGATSAAVNCASDPAVTRRVLALLGDASPAVRAGALRALGAVVAEAELLEGGALALEPGLAAGARDAVLTAAQDAAAPDEVRAGGLEGTGPLVGRPEVAKLITDQLGSTREPLRRAAVLAAGRSGDGARFGAAVVKALDDAAREVALTAITAAGALRLTEARAPLLERLLGDDLAAASRAADALGRLGGAGVERTLEKAATSDEVDDDVRAAARQALERLAEGVTLDAQLAGGSA